MPGRFRILSLSLIVVLSACSGGGGSAVTTAPAKAGSATASGPLTPGSLSLVISNSGSTGSASSRRPAFVSSHSASLGILVGTSTPEVYVDISATSPNCTTGPVTLGSLRTCTIPVTAPAGTPTILLATYDGANGTGNMLAQGSAEPTITAGQTWTTSATMAPVLSALSGGSLAYPSGIPFVIGTPSTATATISGDDPDGTLIPANVTSFASAVTLTSSDPHITVTPLWPGPASTITVTYDGSASVSPTVNITFSKGTTTLSQIAILPTASPIVEFAVPTTASEPVGLALGPDNAIWFVEQTGNNVGRITTTGVLTEYPVPTVNAAPAGLTAGSDGNLWFTEENSSSNQIGRINPATHVVTEFNAGISAFSEPYNITSNPDGNLYFTEYSGNKIARINPTTQLVTEFTIPTAGSFPAYIVTGPDGALWFTESSGNKIGRMTTAGAFTETVIPTASSNASGITVGPDGALWFLEQSGTANKIGRITTAGVITNEFPIPTAAAHPMTIATGADGNLWFSENNNTANKIGRMTTAGVFTEWVIPTANSGPCSIALGFDNNIWFAENNTTGNKIGRI